MSEIPTPEKIFDGRLPEDDVTPEQFNDAINILQSFLNIDPKEVTTLEHLASVTRDLGLSIRRVILSCGVIEITDFSFKDPRIIRRGEALTEAGDGYLGQIVKNHADRTLSAKTIIIRSKKPDGSSTISSVSANSFNNWYDQVQMVTNDRFEGKKKQLTNYYAYIPVNVETDRMSSQFLAFAIDFRQQPTRSYYPLKEGSNPEEIAGYVGVVQDLVRDIIAHLKEKKFIT